jgi:hypothetical protein
MRLRDLFQARSFSGKSPGDILEMTGVLLLLLYLLAGVIYSAVLSPVARFPDEEEYLKLSYNLLHGPGYSMDGVHLTASRPPGYAFFLSAIQAVGGGFFSFRVIQFLLLGATILLVYRLCSERKIFAGLLIVTCLVICYPVLFYTSATLYPQTLSGFLFMLALTLTLATPRGPVLNLVTGFSFGVLILEVPTFLFTTVVVLGAACFLKIIRWREVLLIILAASFIIGAWTTRNAICFHRFVPIASNSGANFLMGNNGQATADEAAANVGVKPYYQQAEKLGLDEFQSDHFYREAALTWIKTHPDRALVLYLEKVLNFFNIMNVYSSRIHAEVSTSRQIVMAVSYLFLLGLLSWRLIETKRFPLIPREKLFLIVYVLSAFTSAIFFTRIRHRLPYDYLIIAIIALNLSRHFEIWMTAQRPPKPALPSAKDNLVGRSKS